MTTTSTTTKKPKKKGWGGTRRGAGRPRIVEYPVVRSFEIERSQYDKLVQYAEMKGMSVSQVVRNLIASIRLKKPTRPARRSKK